MAKNYLKGALEVLVGYSISILIFVVFLYIFSQYLVVYSLVMFLLMFAIVYSDMHKFSQKEKRPQYNLNPYPLKGFVLGLLGFSPYILMEVIYLFIKFDDSIANRIRDLALNTLLGPMYSILKIGHESVLSYVIASSVVIVIAGLGYMAGFYGFVLKVYLKKFNKTPPPPNPGDNYKKTGQNVVKGKSTQSKY